MARSNRSNGVTTRDLGYDRIMRETKRLGDTSVKVGLQADAGSDDDGVRNVDKAFWNEFGTERNGEPHIPERSFIRASLDENRQDIDRTIDRLWSGVKSGKLDARQAANILGQRHEDQMKTKATTGPFTPNAESTIEAKGSSTPLVDTREMINSIRYEVDD